MSVPLEVFCCYAHEDQEMLEHLKKHLMSLQRHGQITVWSDTDLNAGAEREKELHQHLESADLILLLISPDFINSDYCYSTEMRRAIERHDQGSAVVIPILLRATLWRNAPFAKLQVLPRDAKPVRDRGWFDLDEAFNNITERISQVISELQAQRLLTEADNYSHTGYYKEALACYEQVLRLNSVNGPALFGRAGMLYHLKQIDASIEAFAFAKQIVPAAADALSFFLQANALKQRKRYAESLVAYDRVLSLDPRNAAVHAQRAMILIEQKAYEQALSGLEIARHLEPDKAEYTTQAGNLLFRLRRFKQALTMYEQAARLEPDKASHCAWQGQILLHLQRHEDSLTAYQQALAISPQMQYYEQIGKLLLQQARFQEALAIYEQAIQTTKEDNHSLHAGKGQALLQLERDTEAIACYEHAIALSAPNTDPQFLHDLAILYERLVQKSYLLEQQRRVLWQPKTELDQFLTPAFDPAKIMLLHTLNEHTLGITGLVISPNSNILISGSSDNTLRLWDLPSGRALRIFADYRNGVFCMAISPDGRILAGGSLDGSISLWELASGRKRDTLLPLINQGYIHSVAISPDGKFLASGSADLLIRIWGLPDGAYDYGYLKNEPSPQHTGEVRCVAISPDGKFLASGSTDKTIIIWFFPHGVKADTLTGHTGEVQCVAFSPDGKILASGSADGTIKLWNRLGESSIWREPRTLTGHTNMVTCVAISPDGRTLASGSLDATIKLWELPSGRELRTLTGHTDVVNCLAISPDGTILAGGSRDNIIKLWGMEP
jgi:tetratricopeptide (TPR) repeat protein